MSRGLSAYRGGAFGTVGNLVRYPVKSRRYRCYRRFRSQASRTKPRSTSAMAGAR